jgi:hypothetical protein
VIAGLLFESHILVVSFPPIADLRRRGGNWPKVVSPLFDHPARNAACRTKCPLIDPD